MTSAWGVDLESTSLQKAVLINLRPAEDEDMLEATVFVEGAVESQATRVPHPIATRPAGIPRKRTPPNQFNRRMAKQVMPMTGVRNISRAGFWR